MGLWRTQIIPLLTEHHWGDGIDVEAVYGLPVLRERLNIPPPPAEDAAGEDAAGDADGIADPSSQ